MNTPIKVAKFGGTSLADANQIRKAIEIIRSDPQRQLIVVSAPGKRNPADEKVTDILYKVAHGNDAEKNLRAVEIRYFEIVSELGLGLNLVPYFQRIRQDILDGCSAEYIVSRGEYLCGIIVSHALGFQFVDAKGLICFDYRGKYDQDKTSQGFSVVKKLQNAVIPGFYGSKRNGDIQTFSRGGSDVTGAIVAAEIGASVYENWTDVSGILMADPRIIENPKKIETITYRELRELAYMGANVLHDEAVFPVRKSSIPIHIRNTNEPKNEGTKIVSKIEPDERLPGSIIGIAGRKDFTIITITKTMMNQEIGFALKICAVLKKHGVSFEHMPSGIDTMSIVIASRELGRKLETIVEAIKQKCSPDSVEVSHDIAMICVVGQAMVHTPGVAAKVFSALADASINVRMIDQGSSEMNIIVGVSNSDYELAIQKIYRAFAS